MKKGIIVIFYLTFLIIYVIFIMKGDKKNGTKL